MKAVARLTILAVIALSMTTCEVWGGRDNPSDPGAINYQGYPTVTKLQEFQLVSPQNGATLDGTTVAVTKVLRATAYQARFATREADLPAAAAVESTGPSIDISGARLLDQTAYYWQACVKGENGDWGEWTAARRFTTTWMNQAATPYFSPYGNHYGDTYDSTYSTDQTVTITCSTPNSTLYYTTDGNFPTTDSTKYTSPVSVAGHGTRMTIYAIAVATGYRNSDRGSATYYISYPAAATPTFSPVGGTYASDQSVTISCATSGATIYYTTDGSTPTTASTQYTAAILVAGHGTKTTIRATAIADKYSISSPGFASYTIAYPATATPTFNPAGDTYATDQSVTISCATSGAMIYYTTDGTTPTVDSTRYSTPIPVAGNGTKTTIRAIAIADKYSVSSVGAASYTISYPAAATPTFSPAGGTYTSDQSVTISCATSGATIYYTTDGTTPTTNSPRYTAAIPVAGNGTQTTIRAIAVAEKYSVSGVGIATISISYPPTATPTFSLRGGSYSADQTIVILCSIPDAEIYYTTDGATPTRASSRYSQAIEIKANEKAVIKAIAIALGYSVSDTALVSYNLIDEVYVPGGSFLMGSSTGDSDEGPVHAVIVSPFSIGKYEVTQMQYRLIMGENPSSFTGSPNLPVDTVTWLRAIAFCNNLSRSEGRREVYSVNGSTVTADFSCDGWRLPTEAEWEFAAKGGSSSNNFMYSGSNTIATVGWYSSNSGNATNTVGQKGANELGLYDMTGNGYEWCWDWYSFAYSSQGQTNPIGVDAGAYRVVRGGGWHATAWRCRNTARLGVGPAYASGDNCFRVIHR